MDERDRPYAVLRESSRFERAVFAHGTTDATR
jgi:hypothetical protein